MLSRLQNLSTLPVLPVFGKVSALPKLSRLHSNCTAPLREYTLTASAARLRNASAPPTLSRLQNISSLPALHVLGNVRARPILPAYKECKHAGLWNINVLLAQSATKTRPPFAKFAASGGTLTKCIDCTPP